MDLIKRKERKARLDSQLLMFTDEEDMKEAIAELLEDINDPEWLHNLFQQI